MEVSDIIMKRMKVTKHDSNRRTNNLRKYGQTIREIDGEVYCIPVKKTKAHFTVLCYYCLELHTHGSVYGRKTADCKDVGIDHRGGYTVVPNFESI